MYNTRLNNKILLCTPVNNATKTELCFNTETDTQQLRCRRCHGGHSGINVVKESSRECIKYVVLKGLHKKDFEGCKVLLETGWFFDNIYLWCNDNFS